MKLPSSNRNNLERKLLINHSKLIVITIIASLIYSLSNVFATLSISKSVDYLAGEGNADFSQLYKTLTGLVIIYLISAVANWLVSATSNRIAYGVVRDLRHAMFKKLNKLPLSYFDSSPHGDIVSRFVADLDNISDALSLSLVSLFTGIISVVVILIVMLTIDVRLTLVILIITPLTFIAAKIVTKASQDTFRKQQATFGDLSSFISETIGNQKTIKALGYAQESENHFKEVNGDLNEIGSKAHFASAMVNPSTRVVDHLSYISVGVVGGILAIKSGLSVGQVSAFLIFSGQFGKPFNEISGVMSNLQTALASYRRIQQMMAQQEEIPDNDNAIDLVKPKGKVEFKNVDFSYSKKTSLIENLNLVSKPGDLIAIVGPTGAGKTTIVNLLMRFYEIDSGEIIIDDSNILSYTKDSLRSNFGMVLQETWLFNGTIEDNIKYGNPNATHDQVVKAAKAAYAHSFIVRLENGYDTVIAEDSGNLSEGQKQLLTIARVMLTDPSLLILDEATSSIDTLTEKRVQKAFLQLMSNRTSFVIAHRLSTIVQADTILVLDQGRIVETGTHKDLLEKKGFYYSLYSSQFQ